MEIKTLALLAIRDKSRKLIDVRLFFTAAEGYGTVEALYVFDKQSNDYQQKWAQRVLDRDANLIEQCDIVDVVGGIATRTQQVNARYDDLVPKKDGEKVADATIKIGKGKDGNRFDVELSINQTGRNNKAPAISLKLTCSGKPGDFSETVFQGDLALLDGTTREVGEMMGRIMLYGQTKSKPKSECK